MKLLLHLVRRSTAVMTGLALLGWLGAGASPAQAQNATPAATTNIAATNSAAVTNDIEADKAWKALSRAAQQPMPPAEWSTKRPTPEEVDKFYQDTLHHGMDLAKDFYTRYPNHPKAATAKKLEYEMISIATDQFHDTNLAPRLAALESKRMSDPNLSEDEKFEMRVHPLQALMRGMPDTADEVDKQVRALAKDFPKQPEVYKIMMMLLSHSEGARAEAWSKEILASDAPEDIKQSAKLEMRWNGVQKLAEGLPGTADELDKAVRALPKDFPGQPQVYDMMLFALERMDTTRAAALARTIGESDAPDAIKDKVKIVLRIATVEKLIAGLPGTLDEFEAGIHALEKDYPQAGDPYNLLMAAFRKTKGDTARKLGAELLAAPIQERAKSEVEVLLKQMDYLDKPVNIQYTAVDGREVDVTRMKGKVVLVDFWGTWCPVCMAEVPKVKATYAKFHDKGFEIVGIDCNDDKDAMLKAVKTREIPWPQYYEADSSPTKFSTQYGIVFFPTMWLVDKTGILRDVNGSEELEEKVTKLLAE